MGVRHRDVPHNPTLSASYKKGPARGLFCGWLQGGRFETTGFDKFAVKAAPAHPCAPRHLHILVQCKFGRARSARPRRPPTPALGAGHRDVLFRHTARNPTLSKNLLQTIKGPLALHSNGSQNRTLFDKFAVKAAPAHPCAPRQLHILLQRKLGLLAALAPKARQAGRRGGAQGKAVFSSDPTNTAVAGSDAGGARQFS